jgi:hypothetical protein
MGMTGFVTVTTPAASTALTTLAAAYDALGEVAGSADDAITRLIARASAAIGGHCGRGFGVESLTEVFRADDRTGLSPFVQRVAPYGTPLDVQRRPLVLSRVPVVAVASVADTNGALDPSVWECDLAGGLLFRLFGGNRGVWSAPPITVTYSAGYELPLDTSPNLPGDVEDACLALVAQAWAARGRDPALLYDLVEGVGRQQYYDRGAGGMQIDDAMADRLAPYVARAW